MKLSNVLLVAIALAGVAPVAAQAAFVRVDLNNNSETFFDPNISNSDLINISSPALSSFTSSSPGTFNESGTHNGDGVDTSGLSYWDGGAPPVLTYTLTGSATGYDITSVNSIYGWRDSRYRHAAQEWTLAVTTVAVPTFTDITNVVYAPYAANDGAAGSTQVNLTGAIASGVTAVRFTLATYGNPGDPGYTGEYGVVREFDVFGAATVPEPASLGLLGVAGLALVRRRK